MHRHFPRKLEPMNQPHEPPDAREHPRNQRVFSTGEIEHQTAGKPSVNRPHAPAEAVPYFRGDMLTRTDISPILNDKESWDIPTHDRAADAIRPAHSALVHSDLEKDVQSDPSTNPATLRDQTLAFRAGANELASPFQGEDPPDELSPTNAPGAALKRAADFTSTPGGDPSAALNLAEVAKRLDEAAAKLEKALANSPTLMLLRE